MTLADLKKLINRANFENIPDSTLILSYDNGIFKEVSVVSFNLKDSAEEIAIFLSNSKANLPRTSTIIFNN